MLCVESLSSICLSLVEREVDKPRALELLKASRALVS